MTATFYKYQGTGNDFVILDNRTAHFPAKDHDLIRRICDRRFGVGADGLMLLERSEIADFKMRYYNADGKPGSMCGNGGRCIAAFANLLGISQDSVVFEAMGEKYTAEIKDGLVRLMMSDVSQVASYKDHVFLDTGSPHHVTFRDRLDAVDVVNEGRQIRQGEPYGEEGANVNFVERMGEDTFRVRTYERGVEDETLSCGTGVTAVAIASHHLGEAKGNKIKLMTEGGELSIEFKKHKDRYSDIVLIGPATFVFKGEIEI